MQDMSDQALFVFAIYCYAVNHKIPFPIEPNHSQVLLHPISCPRVHIAPRHGNNKTAPKQRRRVANGLISNQISTGETIALSRPRCAVHSPPLNVSKDKRNQEKGNIATKRHMFN